MTYTPQVQHLMNVHRQLKLSIVRTYILPRYVWDAVFNTGINMTGTKNEQDLDSDSIERFLRMEAFSNGDKKLQGMWKNVQLY